MALPPTVLSPPSSCPQVFQSDRSLTGGRLHCPWWMATSECEMLDEKRQGTIEVGGSGL